MPISLALPLLCVARFRALFSDDARELSEFAYYAALMLFGLGNAGSRVARNALVLHLVPNAVMGRVAMFFSAADRLLRTVLTFTCTLIVARGSASLGFAVLLAVLLVAFAGTLATRDIVRTAKTSAA